MTTVVFLGPSLPLEAARRRLDAVYLPPCAMGDVYAALRRYKPQVIAIIDGLFERTPAVWHKEILYALSQDVAVFGGASMGALRAAELAPFGMRGVGRIFDDLHNGVLEDDDEVAVAHLDGSQGFRALSEPMVNLRYGLELAREQGLIDEVVETRLVVAMKALYYPQRSWQALFGSAVAAGLPARQVQNLQQLVDTRRPDRKGEDALAVLDAVAAWRAAPAGSARHAAHADLAFEPTVFWEQLIAQRSTVTAVDDAGEAVSHERLVDHVRLGASDRAELLNEALLVELAERAARSASLPPIDDRAALARFRRERGLASVAALDEWMRLQRIDAPRCLELARTEARLRSWHWRLQVEVNRQLPAVLQRRGRLGATLAAVQAQWSALRQEGIETPEAGDVDSIDEVLHWYQQRCGVVHGDLSAHIVERGFGSPRQFMTELLAQYLADRRRSSQTRCATLPLEQIA